MTPSPIRRLRTAAVALTLTAAAAGTAIAVAGPAHAISNDCQAISSITVNGTPGKTVDGKTTTVAIEYGASVTVVADVKVGTCMFADGVPPSVNAGTLTLERSSDKGQTWTAVPGASTDTNTGVTTVATAGISGTRFLPGLTEFRAHFVGASNEVTGDTFHSAGAAYIFAGPVRIQKSTATRRTASYVEETWKITPAASISGLRVKLQRRVDGAWSTVGVRTVSTAGMFTYRFRKGTTRVVLPAARGYFASTYTVSIS